MERIKLKLKYPDRPLIEPPIRCDLCERMREHWQFSRKSPGESLCHDCIRSAPGRTRYEYSLPWADNVWLDNARSVTALLQQESKNGRRSTPVAC